MKFEDSVLRTLKNYQIKPARTRVEINDKTVKVIFNIKEASYERSLKGGKTRIIEKRNHPKHGNIYAPYTIRNAEGYDDMKPLTEFERDVLSVCISECCNGTYFITPAIIFRALVGKVGEVGVTPSKDQKAAIVHAVEKLQKTKFNKIFAEAYDLLNYKTNGVTIGEDPLLPSKIAPAKINGQPYEVIFFNRESPLFFHANIKNQIVRYDAHLLDVPNMNNTPRIISIKNYIMRRICEIKLHKQLTPALRFDTIIAVSITLTANLNPMLVTLFSVSSSISSNMALLTLTKSTKIRWATSTTLFLSLIPAPINLLFKQILLKIRV